MHPHRGGLPAARLGRERGERWVKKLASTPVAAPPSNCEGLGKGIGPRGVAQGHAPALGPPTGHTGVEERVKSILRVARDGRGGGGWEGRGDGRDEEIVGESGVGCHGSVALREDGLLAPVCRMRRWGPRGGGGGCGGVREAGGGHGGGGRGKWLLLLLLDA